MVTEGALSMRSLLMLMLLTSFVQLNTACSEDEVPRICSVGALVTQQYCPGAENDDIWACKRGSTARCSCPETLYRSRHRKCVRWEQCAERIQKQVPPQTQPPESSDLPMEVPEQLKADPQDDVKVREFIQKSSDIHLLEISSREWNKSDCTCLASRFIENTTSGAKRWIHCYKYANAYFMRDGRQEKLNIKKVMPVPIAASFRVERQNWLYIFVTHTEDEVSQSQPTVSGGGDKLQGKYIVLDYGSDCLLLGFGSYRNGKYQCLMLVQLDSNGNYQQEDKRCFRTKTIMCQDDMDNVWKKDCNDFYIKDKRIDEKIAQESRANKDKA